MTGMRARPMPGVGCDTASDVALTGTLTSIAGRCRTTVLGGPLGWAARVDNMPTKAAAIERTEHFWAFLSEHDRAPQENET
jgi:hypothetical protein